MITAWLVALAVAADVDVMLHTKAFVGAKAQIAGQTVVLPNTAKLPVGTHDLRLVTAAGQVVVKRVTVPAANPQQPLTTVSVDDAPAAGVPGHRFRFEGPAGASLRIDGADAGELPVEVLLAPGAHAVVVTGADGQPTERTLDLRPSGDLTTIRL